MRARIFLLLLAGGGAGLAAEPPPIPLTLQAARETALLRQPRVQIAQLQAQIAEAETSVARAAYLPRADAYFDAVRAASANTRILAGGINNPVIYDRSADGIAVVQLITDFGRTSNLIAGARLSARASAARSDATREQILLGVDAAFYRALAARDVLAVARSMVDAQTTLAQQIGALAKSNLRSDLDVSFAQVGLEQSQLEVQRADGDIQAALASLSAALGYRHTRNFELVQPADDALAHGASSYANVDAAIDDALATRPDLASLRFNREAAEHNVRAERDRSYPVVSAVGEAGNAITHDNRLPNRYAVGGIAVDLPLFTGGAYAARAKEARLQAEVATQNVREAEDAVSRDVHLAWVNLQTARLRAKTVAALVQHARQSYELAKVRYRVGNTSIVELNQAQINASTAEIQEAGARYAELLAESALDYQTGRLH
jgi:outer membrane protein